MKKLLSFVVVSSLVLGACAHSPAPATQTPAPASVTVVTPPAPPAVVDTPPVPEEQAEAPAPVEEPTNFKGNGWELTLPSDGWHELRGSDDDKLGLVNPELKNRIMLLTEETKLTAVAHRDHQAANLPGALKVLPGSKKTVKNNGTTFASFMFGETSEGVTVKVWFWTTVQKGKSYSLLCGGIETSEKVQETACRSVFKSLKINGQ